MTDASIASNARQRRRRDASTATAHWRVIFSRTLIVGALIGLSCVACARSKPRPQTSPAATSDVPQRARATERTSSVTPASHPQAISHAQAASNPPTESSAPAAGSTAPVETPTIATVAPVPELADATGEPLPQTSERPNDDSPSFRRRLELLVEAIAEDDPQRALPAFFPQLAYARVKAIAKPERDWQWRLVRAYERNIHEYHQRLGASAAGLRLVGVEFDEARVKLMKPHSEGNSLPYYRALRSRLLVEKADGTTAAFEITSMISWRGEWYVVHLHGFK